jgi:lysophospholipase L1-like esterase
MVVLSLALLGGEVLYAAGRDYLDGRAAPPVPGEYGDPGAPVLGLALLGDSTAAGVGATTPDATVAGGLGRLLAESSGRRVRLTSVAVSGADSGDMPAQADRLLAENRDVDVVVVLVGANDVTHLTTLDDVRRDLRTTVQRLRAAGLAVVVGTCPDMGTSRAIPQPVREISAWRGRAVGAVEREAVADAGGVPVDLEELTGPAFRADPGLLASDQYHPSDRGYALWVQALAPAVIRAVDGKTG